MIEPILKWAGGKRQLLSKLKKYINIDELNGHTFYEPFVGGGALTFSLEYCNVVINDKNKELINTYIVVRDKPNELIEKLKEHQRNFNRDYYYKVRAMDREDNFEKNISDVERAARLIFLNKACFNGLYRVNSNGYFNVPIGGGQKPDFVMESKIHAMSEYFKNNNVKIEAGEYSDCVKDAKRGDIIYFDPPYDYEKSGFVSYVKYGFSKDELTKLKSCCDELIKKGCKVVLSNNDTKNVRDIFDCGYKFEEVLAKRFINCDGKKRSEVKEVIIYGGYKDK